MPSISLCMICKDEEELLPGCLESIADAVSEIVIVDTGSTDGTIEIARSFNARVIEADWTDFSTARNQALDAAGGDWVLSLDADEELIVDAPGRLRELAASGSADAFSVRVVNVVEMSEYVDFNRSPQIYLSRLFKRAGARWVNPIHENIVLPDPAATAAAEGVDILHYGYLENILTSRGKRERNYYLLEKWLRDQPDDPMPHFYFANHVRAEGDYARALVEYEAALPKLISANAFACGADAFKYLAECYEKVGLPERVAPLLERATSVYPDYAELQYAYGCRLLETGETAPAIERFRLCLQLVEDTPKYALSLRGAGSWRALERLGAAWRSESSYDRALVALSLASAISGKSLVKPADIADAEGDAEVRQKLNAIDANLEHSIEPTLAWLFERRPLA